MKYLTTVKGYSFFAVSSAFQKSIRRGLEDDAMYWAVELYASGFDEYLWRRIKIIACEDVGLAEPLICVQIASLYQMYKEQKAHSKKENDKPSERIFLTNAIILLVRAKKSRVIDHLQVYYFRNHATAEKRDIPDWANDKHTPKGKALGRGFEHFFEEGAKLNNMANVEGEEYYLELAKNILMNPVSSDNSKNELF